RGGPKRRIGCWIVGRRIHRACGIRFWMLSRPEKHGHWLCWTPWKTGELARRSSMLAAGSSFSLRAAKQSARKRKKHWLAEVRRIGRRWSRRIWRRRPLEMATGPEERQRSPSDVRIVTAWEERASPLGQILRR